MNALDQQEFQALFAQEAEQRLATLAQLLLQLEHDGSDEALIGSIFREVHTLKGSAAVVGFDGVSRVAHQLESCLDDLRSGRTAVTPDLVDALLTAVDTLSALIALAVAGGEAGPDAVVAEAAMAVALERFVAAGPVTDQLVADQPVTDQLVTDQVVTNQAVAPGGIEANLPDASGVPTEVSATPRAPARSEPAARDGGVVMVPLERLDELVRLVGESAAAHLRVGRVLSAQTGVEPDAIAEFSELSRILNELQERTMRTRMVPVATVTDQLNRTVRDLARSLGKAVHWEVRGGDTELDRGVLHQLSDSLIHLVRNAVDHGIESPDDREAAGKPREATIRLHAMQLGSEVIIAVTDDGKGIDVDRVRSQATRQGIDCADLSDDDALQLVFRSGLSTARFVSDISGRGVGLDVVRTSVEAVRGRVEVRSQHGSGTEFRIVVPVTLAVLPCLLVVVGGQRFALALHSVVLAQADPETTLAHAEGRPAIWIDGHPVPVSSLAQTLRMPPTEPQHGPVVVLAGTSHRHAFQVDGLVGQRDVVVKGIGRLLPRLQVIAGASVDPDGSILLVLDAPGLVDRARQTKGATAGTAHRAEQSPVRDASLLVVDDALTVRELQRTILERAGYRVRVASDGIEALALLAQEPSDLVLTDVEMPRMDGFALTEAIRAHAGLSNVPVLVLTSRSSDADRLRGLEAGADGYIVKSAFDERGLLTAIERLLGNRA